MSQETSEAKVEVLSSHLGEVKLLRSMRHIDSRGFFAEAYSKRAYAELGIDVEFVQDNHSLSRKKGVLRGLHFQREPFAQTKLLQVLRGAIFDVVVDLRMGSPTYAQHVATVLNAEDWNQIFIPAGFAHGFCTLQAETEILYKVDRYYSVAHESGIRWNDPALGIPWPITAAELEISEKDQTLPLLAELGRVFVFSEMRVRASL